MDAQGFRQWCVVTRVRSRCRAVVNAVRYVWSCAWTGAVRLLCKRRTCLIDDESEVEPSPSAQFHAVFGEAVFNVRCWLRAPRVVTTGHCRSFRHRRACSPPPCGVCIRALRASGLSVGRRHVTPPSRCVVRSFWRATTASRSSRQCSSVRLCCTCKWVTTSPAATRLLPSQRCCRGCVRGTRWTIAAAATAGAAGPTSRRPCRGRRRPLLSLAWSAAPTQVCLVLVLVCLYRVHVLRLCLRLDVDVDMVYVSVGVLYLSVLLCLLHWVASRHSHVHACVYLEQLSWAQLRSQRRLKPSQWPWSRRRTAATSSERRCVAAASWTACRGRRVDALRCCAVRRAVQRTWTGLRDASDTPSVTKERAEEVLVAVCMRGIIVMSMTDCVRERACRCCPARSCVDRLRRRVRADTV
jgi:hypothetical protein